MSNLSKLQQELADLLFNTKTEAKVIKRRKNAGGSYYLENTTRKTSPIDFAQSEEEFALKIHEVRIDSPLSPIYVSLRNLPENVLQKIAEVLSEVKFDTPQDYCSGVPKAAVIIAQKFAEVSGLPFIDVFDKIGPDTNRKIVIKEGIKVDENEHGSSTSKNRLLVIDDVIAHGKSKLEALESAKESGFYINMLVLIDREQGGVEQVEKEGCRVYSALKLTDILKYYLEKGMITKKQFDDTISYLKSSRI